MKKTMMELIGIAGTNHIICEKLMAARKLTSIVASQYLLVRNLMNGESKRTDRSLEDERKKLQNLTVLAARKVLALNSQYRFLSRFYNIKGENRLVEALSLCLDFDAQMARTEYEIAEAER